MTWDQRLTLLRFCISLGVPLLGLIFSELLGTDKSHKIDSLSDVLINVAKGDGTRRQKLGASALAMGFLAFVWAAGGLLPRLISGPVIDTATFPSQVVPSRVNCSQLKELVGSYTGFIEERPVILQIHNVRSTADGALFDYTFVRDGDTRQQGREGVFRTSDCMITFPRMTHVAATVFDAGKSFVATEPAWQLTRRD